MARGDGIDRTNARNMRLTATKIGNTQQHNEREKDSYVNQDIVLERTPLNVHFKTPSAGYQEMFAQMEADGVISTRGIKEDAFRYGELVFDVNSAYFYNHSGYDFAKQFYTEAYKAAIKIVGGEQYILSAVMHADERNRAMSEALGEDVYHYHLHVVYIPVVEKEIRWTKRCKDKSLVGKVKILPYFGQRKISEITTKDVIAWQNEQLAYRDEKHKPYSQTYLKTLHNQLSAIFNHAVRFYDLRANPASKAGNMGNEERREMLFWTKEEYQKFAAEMMDKPVSYYAFEMLYWCGIREGELLALTPADFDFQNSTVRINKSYQRLHGEDVITSPKTRKSNRTIKMPRFLCEEIQDYLGMLYGLKKKDRIFTVTKSYLHHEMDRGSKAAGVKRIRIHDLRHSHISLLIDMGFSAVAIADRVGHESIEITYRYAHLFPSKQSEMAKKLDFERSEL